MVIECKRKTSVSLVSQGLFHLIQEGLDVAVMGRGSDPAQLTCVAASFSRHLSDAVQQIGRRIDLVQCARSGDDVLALTIRSPEGRWAPGGCAWPGIAYNHSCPQKPHMPLLADPAPSEASLRNGRNVVRRQRSCSALRSSASAKRGRHGMRFRHTGFRTRACGPGAMP